MAEGESVQLVEHDAGVSEIVLDRPESMNAISLAMADEITMAVERVRALRPTVVVLSSSSDRAFSVGADLKERRAMDAETLLAMRPRFVRAYRALLSVRPPIVAGIDGFCFGGGFELALACDLIVCSEGARFAFPEVAVGLVPGGGGTQLLGRRAGWRVATDLILTARRIDGVDAERLGIADRCCSGSARAAALQLAERIAKNSPAALALAKRSMRDGCDLDLAGGLDLEDEIWRTAARSPDHAEGLAAFAEKRPPRWASAEPRKSDR